MPHILTILSIGIYINVKWPCDGESADIPIGIRAIFIDVQIKNVGTVISKTIYIFSEGVARMLMVQVKAR